MCFFSYYKWPSCFLSAGVPLLHLDVFPTWFSGSCRWGGQRSLCQTAGPYTQPWWVQWTQTHNVARPLSCETIWLTSSIDLQYRVSVRPCCNWLLVNAAHYPLVLNSFPMYGPSPNLFDCLEKLCWKNSVMYESLKKQVKAVPGHTYIACGFIVFWWR